MYVYSTRKEPNVPRFTAEWAEVRDIRDQGLLAFYKKVNDVAEGSDYIASKFTEYVAPNPEAINTTGKWCAAEQRLVIYRNDKGYFTRRSKKVDDEWKTLFIPVYFSDDVNPLVEKKSTIVADIHWAVIGKENLKLAIVIDKIHAEGDLPF